MSKNNSIIKDIKYVGDMPHTIRCNKCHKVFWTGEHISYGMCKDCGGNISEMNETYAKKILATWGLREWKISKNA